MIPLRAGAREIAPHADRVVALAQRPWHCRREVADVTVGPDRKPDQISADKDEGNPACKAAWCLESSRSRSATT